jgi:copper(I)-binding protein
MIDWPESHRMDVPQKLACVTALAWLGMSVALAAESVSTTNAWVRATVPGQSVAGAYLDITASVPTSLIAVESSVAAKGELHTMSVDGGVMRMRAVGKIELPANQAVNLKPGGYHIMLTDIKRELKAGERVPLKLTLQDSHGVTSILEVDAEVRAVTGAIQHEK